MAAMKKRITVIIFFCILIGYVLLFPDGLQKELVFLPSWALDIDSAQGDSEGSGAPIPFKLDDRLGYFSRSGKLSYSEKIVHDAVVSDDYFINFSSVSMNLVLQETNGEIIGNIPTEGLPFLFGDRLFVISPDRMIVSEYSDGTLLWSVSPGSIITSIDVNARLTLLGLMNGDVLLYDEGGDEIFSFFSTESRYSIIYSCALSDDSRRIAVVSGLDPQQLIFFESKNDSYTAVMRKNLENQYRRNLFIDYSSDGNLLYVEVPEGLSVIKTDSLGGSFLPLDGVVASDELRSMTELSYLILKNKEKSVLRVFRPDVGKIASFNLPGGNLYFNPDENCVYLGWNGIIVRYDIIEG